MFAFELLDERKKLILKSIIDDYISTAEPVGSRTLAKRNHLGLSPATIRNEMSDLEEMGYLEQPHTSAGRVPSVRGYRLYVDNLMNIATLSSEEVAFIKSNMEMKIDELADLIKQASNIISKITNYTSIVTSPQLKSSKIRSMQVVYLEPTKVLIVLVTNEGAVKHSLVKISDYVLPEYIIKISNFLNAKLSGLTIEQLNMSLIQEIEREIGLSKESLFSILSDITQSLQRDDYNEVYLDGAVNIFNYQEFNDVAKAKEFFNLLHKTETINKLLLPTGDINKVAVKIGEENDVEQAKDCSVVTATYRLGNYVIGTIGVIGPKRMEYPRVITAMDHIRKKLNEELNKLTGEENNTNEQKF